MLILLIFSLNVFAAQPPVIYGEDNRRDLYEEKNPKFLEFARATAAKVPTIFMRTVGKDVVFRTMTLVDRGICDSERFATQTTVSMCSGFLVGPKTLVTAGHCIKNANDCKNFRWVFDYGVTSKDQLKVTVTPKSVFSCKKVLSQKFDDNEDYAVIELDRATDRKPLAFRKSGTVSPGAALLVIGNPSGLPTKLADGASVRHLDTHWFTANLDTFAGNSGSAVINTETNEVEGILVRGEDDYVDDPARGCKVAKRCADNECRGEDVNFISGLPGLP